MERWRMVDGGKAIEVIFTVDDPDAFYDDKHKAARHAADVNRFIDLLLNASAPVSVVATVRADFYTR